MSKDLAIADTGALATLDDVAAKAREYFEASQADNTRKAYGADLRHFGAWCATNGLSSLPAEPQAVALYLTAHAGLLKVSTLQRRLSAIAGAHKLKGLESPTRHAAVTTVWSGIRRSHGTAHEKKAPVLGADLKTMVRALPNSLTGIRDRALLLVGFGGAFRRSELVALDVGDVGESSEGLVITILRSKTNQEGEGRRIGIPYGRNLDTCAVSAVTAWREAAGIDEGALFRSVNRHGHVGGRLSDKGVALVVKRSAEAVGLDPTRYAGHSLRSGLATSAAAAGASERAIANQTGHKSLKVLRGYIREGSLFRENAAATVL